MRCVGRRLRPTLQPRSGASRLFRMVSVADAGISPVPNLSRVSRSRVGWLTNCTSRMRSSSQRCIRATATGRVSQSWLCINNRCLSNCAAPKLKGEECIWIDRFCLSRGACRPHPCRLVMLTARRSRGSSNDRSGTCPMCRTDRRSTWSTKSPTSIAAISLSTASCISPGCCPTTRSTRSRSTTTGSCAARSRSRARTSATWPATMAGTLPTSRSST